MVIMKYMYLLFMFQEANNSLSNNGEQSKQVRTTAKHKGYYKKDADCEVKCNQWEEVCGEDEHYVETNFIQTCNSKEIADDNAYHEENINDMNNDESTDDVDANLKDILENLIQNPGNTDDLTLSDNENDSDIYNLPDEPMLFDGGDIIDDTTPVQSEYGTDNEVLYPGASITIGIFMLLIALFSTKYNFTGEAIEQLLSIFALVLPNGHSVCNSLYEFKKYFKQLKNPIVKHFYCPFCLGYIANSGVDICTNTYCRKDITKDKCYFLEIPLVNQIQSFFIEDGVYNKLQERFEYFKVDGVYRDIYDGSLYRSYFNNSGPLSYPENVSFVLNTDGAPVFKSSKVTIWPLYLVINELPYKLRIRKENMLLAGLWFGTKKPAMNTFLKPMLKSMELLHEGIDCFSRDRGNFKCKGYLLAATADLPARCLLCNAIQYNGAFSCWKCLQSGQTAKVGKGHTRVFPYIDECPKGPVRTQEQVKGDALDAVEHQRAPVNGVKGPSWLICFPKFDIIQGIAIDYMHCILLGVQKLLIKLWFSKDFSGKQFNFYESVNEADKQLLSILPTMNISRLPRTIANDLQYWKASEFRSFLLYYGAPILQGILDQERFQHYLNLVNATHILLLCGSTCEDLEHAEKMLLQFCSSFANLYDVCYMTLNIHQLVHFVDCVRQLGPLYTHSCFPFEDKNGFVLKLIRGTQNIDNQILTGVSFVQKLPELKQRCIKNGTEAERIYEVVENSSCLRRKEKIADGIYVLGGIHQKRVSEEDFHLICYLLGYCPATDTFNSFNRIEFHGNLIYGLEYTRMKKRNNSAIQYQVERHVQFGLVKYFVSLGAMVGAIVQNLECTNYDEKCFILSVRKNSGTSIIPVTAIKQSCMFVEIITNNVTKTYICLFPNDLEGD